MNAAEMPTPRWYRPLVVVPMVLGGTVGAIIGTIVMGNALAALLVWIMRFTGRQHILWNWGIPALAGFAMVAVVLVSFEVLAWLLLGKPRLSAIPPVARMAMVIPLFVGMMLTLAVFGGPFIFLGLNSRWITEPLTAIGVPHGWIAGQDVPVPWIIKLSLLGFLALPFVPMSEKPKDDKS